MKLLAKKYVQSDAKNMLWDLKRLPSNGPGPPELWDTVSRRTTLLRISVWKLFASKKQKEARESGDRWGLDRPRGVGNAALDRIHMMVAGDRSKLGWRMGWKQMALSVWKLTQP